MDYEQKYNDALEFIRKIYSSLSKAAKEEAEHYFSELKESEDEKIRKWLIDYFDKVNEEVIKEDRLKIITYLEKQKEQKPARWLDGGMSAAREDLIACCRDWERGERTTLLPIVATRARYFLEHLQQPAEWSGDDEKMLRTIISDGVRGVGLDNSQVDWLKSLRPKPHWNQENMIELFRPISGTRIDKAIRQAVEKVTASGRKIVFEFNDWNKIIEPGDSQGDLLNEWYERARHWKPSKEQMRCLEFAIKQLERNYLIGPGRAEDKGLYQLVNDLRTL